MILFHFYFFYFSAVIFVLFFLPANKVTFSSFLFWVHLK